MKAVCTNSNLFVLDPRLKEFAFYQDKDMGEVDLTIEKQYIIYGIRENKLGKFYLVLTDDYRNHVPWWMPANFFEIVDEVTPKTWQKDEWEGIGHEIIQANPVYFDVMEDIEDGTEKGHETFKIMRKDAESVSDIQ